MIHTKVPPKNGKRGKQIFSINPNTGELLGSVPICDADEVVSAVRRARTAQAGWAARPLAQRIQVMHQVQEALVDHAQEIARSVSQEMGKPEIDSLIGDVLITLTSLKGTLKLAPQVLRPRRPAQGLLHSTKRTYIIREPLGVVGIISPFNYPVLLSLQIAFAALVTGNGVVHKPSEYASLSGLQIQSLFQEAGLPRDLFQIVTGGAETGEALIDSGIDHISFVGSSRAGREVAMGAARNLISSTLELGGNNHMIVLEDAQLVRAVDGALAYAFTANGQLCAAARHLLVHELIVEDFINALQARLANWKISTEAGPGGGDVTAMINEKALARVDQNVQEAIAAGARVLCGGQRLTGSKAPVYEPTILIDTTADMAILQNETFGPMITVTAVSSDEQAITIANDSPYGLTASVWTRDDKRAWEIARRLQVATVAINDHLWPFFAPEVPWGGVKASGLGRVGGREGLESMTYLKVISYDRFNLPREPYWYPRPKWLHFTLLMLIPLLYSLQFSKKARALWQLISGFREANRNQAAH